MSEGDVSVTRNVKISPFQFLVISKKQSNLIVFTSYFVPE